MAVFVSIRNLPRVIFEKEIFYSTSLVHLLCSFFFTELVKSNTAHNYGQLVAGYRLTSGQVRKTFENPSKNPFLFSVC
jgi:hypothetical protein